MNLAYDSRFAKILPNQNLPLKHFECRADVICQFIAARSLIIIHWLEIHSSNILSCTVFRMNISQTMIAGKLAGCYIWQYRQK